MDSFCWLFPAKIIASLPCPHETNVMLDGINNVILHMRNMPKGAM